MKSPWLAFWLTLVFTPLGAAEVSGVFLDDRIELDDGETLVLNGAGLREKFWIDVYVGSLYLPQATRDVAEILSKPGPLRIQMDFVYKEVSSEQLLDTWREGFENNQSDENLQALNPRLDQFYQLFDSSALARDRYQFDYRPGVGTRISKNQQELGVIAGEDFRNALVEIWLGNQPADKSLKKALLGL